MPGVDEEHPQHAANVGDTVVPDHAVDQRPVLLLQPVEDVAVDEDDEEDGGGEHQVHPDVILVLLVDDIVSLDNLHDCVKPGDCVVPSLC